MWARVIAGAFASMEMDEVLVYQDDIMVYSTTFGEHMATLQKAYDCMRAQDLTFKVTKMKLDYPAVVFLGHMLDASGRYPSPENVDAIRRMAYPNKDQTAVRSFIGLTLYYRNYIHAYSDKVMCLHALTRKGVNVPKEWTAEHELAVDILKEDLMGAPCLRLVDNSRPFQVRVDACRRGRGCGAILLQPDDEGEWHPVCYWSRSLNKHEKEYSATEVECKAMHDALMYWDVYLKSVQHFEVYTDHNALTYMWVGQTQSNNGRLMRWLMDLQGYSFDLIYKKGEWHQDADAVSRMYQFGEEEEFLTTDVLEWDKGIPTEEALEFAKDQEEKRARRVQMAIERKERLKTEAGADGARVVMAGISQRIGRSRRAERTRWRREERHLLEEEFKVMPEEIELGGGRSNLVVDPEQVRQYRVARQQWRTASRGSPLGRRVSFWDDGERREDLARLWRGVMAGLSTKGSDRVLRTRPGAAVTKESPKGSDWVEREEDLEVRELREQKIRGHEGVRVMPSSIPGAGRGLFSARKVKEGASICDYAGVIVPKAEVNRDSYDSDYVFEYEVKGKAVCVDARMLRSCYGRFINDPVDDHRVNNARAVTRGNRLIIVATTEIQPGEEIFISYGLDYWMDRLSVLPGETAARVQKEYAERERRRAQRKIGRGEEHPKLATIRAGDDMGSSGDPKVAAKKVRSAVEQMDAVDMEKYAYDNQMQEPDLAEELQYLVGRKYVDDENGKLYRVERVWFSTTARAVVGTRKMEQWRRWTMTVFTFMGLWDCYS